MGYSGLGVVCSIYLLSVNKNQYSIIVYTRSTTHHGV